MTGLAAAFLLIFRVISIGQGRNHGAALGNRVVLDLECPRRVDRRLGHSCERQVERDVRHVEEFLVGTEHRTGREEQTADRAVLTDAVEIAALGNDFRKRVAERIDRVRVDDVDLVLLIGDDPEITAAVDGDAVRRIDPGGQNFGRPATDTEPSWFKVTGTLTIG